MTTILHPVEHPASYRSMLRAREAVVWTAIAWVAFVVALGATVLLTEPAAAGPGFDSYAAGGDVGMSDGGGALAQVMNPDRWTAGLSAEHGWLRRSLVLLGLATCGVLAWSGGTLFTCARRHGGTSYAVGHLGLMLALTPVLLVGPLWVPLLVRSDAEGGQARHARELTRSKVPDLVAFALLAALVAAYVL